MPKFICKNKQWATTDFQVIISEWRLKEDPGTGNTWHGTRSLKPAGGCLCNYRAIQTTNLVPRDTNKMFYSFTWESASKHGVVAQAYNPNYPGSWGQEAPKIQACLGKLSHDPKSYTTRNVLLLYKLRGDLVPMGILWCWASIRTPHPFQSASDQDLTHL